MCMAAYILRDIDDALWKRVKIQAAKDGKPIRTVLLALLAKYAKAVVVLAALVLASACSGSTMAPSAATTVPSAQIDLLTFVIGDQSLWPRTGTQEQAQTVDMGKREVCWVKYGQSEMFECWRWDDRWIYHEVDHALDGDRLGQSYRFTDGRWLPRFLSVSDVWTLDLPANQAIDMTATCQSSAPRRFPYRLTAHLEDAQELGPLGRRRVLVLDYQPYDGSNNGVTERFSFAEGAGWYLWQSDRGTARFDTMGGPNVSRSTFCGQ